MYCPNCNTALEQKLTQRGVVLDYCNTCRGVWFDGGELFLFADFSDQLYEELYKAFENKQGVLKICPRCRKKLYAANFMMSLNIDRCDDCDGLWFDKDEFEKLTKLLNVKYAAEFIEESEGQIIKKHTLTDLYSRSVLILLILYGILFFIFGFGIYVFGNVGLSSVFLPALIVTIVVILIQFLLAPFLMDFSLYIFYGARRIDLSLLPEQVQEFIKKFCAKHKMSLPTFNLIYDMSPNAFTYGLNKSLYRVVITEGIIKLLTDDELIAVLGHELGHVKHYDLAVMTLAVIVPSTLYSIYRGTVKLISRMKPSLGGGKKKGDPRALMFIFAIACYVGYVITSFLVLLLSRTREYMADFIGGKESGNPNFLTIALAKIAYGLARGGVKTPQTQEEALTVGKAKSLTALSIFPTEHSHRFVALSGLSTNTSKYQEVDLQTIKDTMKWDIVNPWASWIELNSSHPLPAKRMLVLSCLAKEMNIKPAVEFKYFPRKISWWHFIYENLLSFLPYLFGILSVLSISVIPYITKGRGLIPIVGVSPLVFLSISMFLWFVFLRISLNYSYTTKSPQHFKIASLLKFLKVSPLYSIPCKIKGKLLGKGIPGYIFSEDFVVQDETGFIFVDYQHMLGLMNYIFSIFSLPDLIGKEVEIEGWFRRAVVPYIELKKIKIGGKEYGAQAYKWKYIFCYFLGIASLVLFLLVILR